MNRMALIMICLVLVFSMVSCDDQGEAVGYGSLSVEVSDGVNSKTIRPTDESLAFASYRIEGRHRTIEGRTVDETFNSGKIEIDRLETGDWEFMVEGINKDGVLLAKSDTHIVTIKTNGNSKETYTLDWIMGHGTLRLSVKVQTSRVSTIECQLYDEDGCEAGTYVMPKADSRQDGEGFLVFEHSFIDVPTGSYDATMTMKDKDGRTIGRALHPSVHIHDGLVSSYGFSWENFRNLLPSVDAPKVTNIVEGSTTVSCDSSILLGTEEDDAIIFYSFDGKTYSQYPGGAIDLSKIENLEDGITVWTYAEKDNLNKSDVGTYTFNVEHNSPDRANAVYTWNAIEGGYECVATSKCLYHTGVECETEKAVASYQVITDSTCSKEGVGRYTAEFAKEGYTIQSKDEDIARKHIYDREVVEDKYIKSAATCLKAAVYYKSCECGRPSSEDWFSYGNPLGHDLVHHEAKAVTCTGIGWNEYDTCSRCSYTTYEEIPALGHKLEHHDAKNPTCTEIGWSSYDTCTRCDYTTYNELAALRHDLVHHEAQAVTCTEIGWDAYDTCTRCEYTTYKEISALGHDLVHHEAKEPTCTEVGWDSYDKCSRGDYTSKVEKPALDHNYVTTETKAPTCTDTGMYEHVCSRCGHTTYESIPKLGHELEHHEAKKPTCTEIGWSSYDTCTRCEYTTYKVIAELGHDKVHHEAKAVTCTEIGWDEYDSCTRCNYSTYNEISALGHDYVKTETKSPTCTETGMQEHICSRCGHTIYETIPELGHNLKYHAAKNPTCTEIGWSSYDTCTRCEYTTYKEIAALGHNYLFSRVDDEYHGWVCSRCKNAIDKEHHSFKDYKCETCGVWGRGPSGGYVFYDRGSYTEGVHSWRYLEAAPADLRLVEGIPTVDSTKAGYAYGTSEFIFGYYRENSDGSNVLLSTRIGIGVGYNNTDILVGKMQDAAFTAYSGTGTTSSYAARLCDVLEYEVNGEEFNDWFLPSQNELSSMYSYLHKQGLGSFASDNYWSSSEYYATAAWTQDFDGGTQCHSRHSEYRVRPVRAF